MEFYIPLIVILVYHLQVHQGQTAVLKLGKSSFHIFLHYNISHQFAHFSNGVSWFKRTITCVKWISTFLMPILTFLKWMQTFHFFPRVNEVEEKGIQLAQALALVPAPASASASAPAAKSSLYVFVEVYSSAFTAPRFTKPGVHIFRYVMNHRLASLELDANHMLETCWVETWLFWKCWTWTIAAHTWLGLLW